MNPTAGRLFGTDGVRGIANVDLSVDLAVALGRALGAYLAETGAPAQVLLGRDSRVSGTMLAAAATAGLCSAGAAVRDCGLLPTPALCLLIRESEAGAGLVISASHNPPPYNGLKLVSEQGGKFPAEVEARLEQMVRGDEQPAPRPTGTEVGQLTDWPQAEEEYLERLWTYLDPPVDLSGLRVVLDCAWGAECRLAPQALARAGAQVEALHAEPRGELINHDCGSTHPAALAARVRATGADLGIAFDGDGDRAILVDHTGEVCDGDYVKYLLACDLQDRGRLDPPLVVGTVMTNLGLELALRRRGIELIRAEVGDRKVQAEMARSGARLGGEQSGHVILAETGIGDGLYSALRVCAALRRAGRPLAELCAPLVKSPQVLVNVPVLDRCAWAHSSRLAQAQADWERRLGEQGRVLIRPSGTEPVVRVMVEAATVALAQAAAADLAHLIAAETGFGDPPAEEE